MLSSYKEKKKKTTKGVFIAKLSSAGLKQPLQYGVIKPSISNVTLDSSCLLPALLAGISRRRQSCILGTYVALIAVTLVQATMNAFVLIAVEVFMR